MKRTILAATLGLVLCRSAFGVDPIYINYGVVTNSPVVDAIAFDNRGTILLTNAANNGLLYNAPTIYETQNTRYYTNQGAMVGSLGFRFETIKNTTQGYTRVPASVFTNSGSIMAVDDGGLGSYYGTGLLTYYYGTGLASASYALISATNIGNSGTISVGDVGIIKLTGKNVDLSRGALVAGTAANTDTNTFYGSYVGNSGRGYLLGTNMYVNANGVQDFYWYVGTNTTDLVNFISMPPNTPFVPVTPNAQFQTWVYTNTLGTNTYVNIVFVRTNELDPNISIDVHFNRGGYFFSDTNVDFFATEAIVRFGSVGQDVISGGSITNAVYLLDTGAEQNSIVLLTNAIMDGTLRPSNFEITTAMPYEWVYSATNNFQYDPALIYPGLDPAGPYASRVVATTDSEYAAQIGRDTETVNGLVNFYNNYYYYPYYYLYNYYPDMINLSDPTNEAARIEINAGNLNLSNARIRAEGLLTLNAKHLVPEAHADIDVGSFSCDLGSTNGFLCVSNVLPATHARCRGNIYAYAANWANMTTNDTSTNFYKFHILVVDHMIKGNLIPTIRNLALRAPTVYAQDTIRVVRKSLFDAEKLTFNGPVTLTEEASRLDGSNVPKLKNFTVETNGYFHAENLVILTNNLTSFVNRGKVEGAALFFKAATIENGGTLRSTNTGSIFIDAGSLSLTTNNASIIGEDPITRLPVLIPVPDRVISGYDISISAKTLSANYCVLSNGLSGGGKLSINVSGSLSDFVPATPGTNDVLKNFWQVKNGFALGVKPKTGDLFGTKITSCATNFAQPMHVWAGEDRGASVSGFTNNVVIGHLVLDCQTEKSSLRFAGAGRKNGLYVDYLELQNYAYTNFAKALAIEDNLVIYFADSNVDPTKLQSIYKGHLVWVPEFAGPNSSTTVPAMLQGQSTNIFVNRALADSGDVDSNRNGVPNKYDQPYPFDGTILSVQTTGNGSILPSLDTRVLVIGQSYGLNAVPAPGYVFTGWTWTADSGNPAMNPSAPKISFVMQPNLVLTANFVADSGYLNITTNGSGTVSPDLNARLLFLGKAYRLTAIPAPGNLFVGWTGSITTNTASLSFIMRTNISLAANFVTNPYPAMKGSYNGLFYVGNNGVDASDLNLESSGSFTVSVTTKGVASGKLVTALGTYPFTAQFDLNGAAQAIVKRGKATSWTLALQLDASGSQSAVMTGSVAGANWDATLLGDRTIYDGRTLIAPAKGSYTLALPGVGASESGPMGDSYGSVTVSGSGIATISGKLADGTSFSQSATLGANARWPFFYNRAGKDSLLGWISFDTNDFGGLVGSVRWAKKAGATSLYKAGFTNVFDCIGSRYVAPIDRSSGLLLVNPMVVLSGGDLAIHTPYSVTWDAKALSYKSVNGAMSLTVSPRTGLFTGKWVNTATGKSTVLNGIVLQKQNVARGCFYGVAGSGEVLLQNEE